jgi:preprotein translocase subunit YajC
VTEVGIALWTAPRQGASGSFVFFLNVTLVIFIFYFLLIRPQRKERQRHDQMIASLKKGDEVVTAGGIVGTVIRAQEKELVIKTAGETKVTVERERIARKIEPATEG